jgi:hypothetical protein
MPDPEEIARAGAFVSIDGSDDVRIERAYVRPEDEPPVPQFDVFLKALSQLVLKPSSVRGRPNELTRMVTAERASERHRAQPSAAPPLVWLHDAGPCGRVTIGFPA